MRVTLTLLMFLGSLVFSPGFLFADEIVPAASAPAAPADVKIKVETSPAVDHNDAEWKTMHSEVTNHSTAVRKAAPKIKFDLAKARVLTPPIHFKFNSDKPDKDSQAVLKSLAATLNKHTDLAIRIEGHTDSVGYDQPNLDISQRRADQVREALVKNGVAAERLQSQGMGDRQPIESNKTPQGQEKNRRVEFVIAGTLQAPPVPEPAPAPAAVIPPEPPPTPQPVAPQPLPPALPPAPTVAPTMQMPMPSPPSPVAPQIQAQPVVPAQPMPLPSAMVAPSMPPLQAAPQQQPRQPTAPAPMPNLYEQPAPPPAPVAPAPVPAPSVPQVQPPTPSVTSTLAPSAPLPAPSSPPPMALPPVVR